MRQPRVTGWSHLPFSWLHALFDRGGSAVVNCVSVLEAVR